MTTTGSGNTAVDVQLTYPSDQPPTIYTNVPPTTMQQQGVVKDVNPGSTTGGHVGNIGNVGPGNPGYTAYSAGKLVGNPGGNDAKTLNIVDDPTLQQDGDEDVWEGGIVRYYDGSTVRRSRRLGDRIWGFDEFSRPMIWRAAIMEMFGTMLWVLYLSCGWIGFDLYFSTTPGDTQYRIMWFALGVFVLLPLLIFATSVASGGHLNPIITLATMFAGFTKVSRGILYILAQFIGGIVASALVWGWLSSAAADAYGAGNCYAGPLSRSQALLIETVANFMWLFVIFGVAFDPAQSRIFGPVLAPIFIAAALGVIIILTGLSGGYGGTWSHPARCFGAAVISGRFGMEVWVSIVAWVIASVLMGGLYLLVPFNHELRSRKKII